METGPPAAEISIHRPAGAARTRVFWASFAAALLMLASFPAAAEDLVSGISQDIIQITSHYTGTDIVVFGDIEQPESLTGYDVVVVVRGPGTDITVRKRARIAGIWINSDAATLSGMPSYYFLASSRPLAQVGAAGIMQRYGIGLQNLEPNIVSSHHAVEPFRQALLRHLQKDALYTENPAGVEFLSNTLFRARVPVPATVTRGEYNAEVYLFRGGDVVSAQSTPLFIDQTGIERRLFNFARQSPLYYGFSTVLMAILLGWLASVIFRRAA